MRDLASNRWIRVAAWMVSMSGVWALLAPYGLAGTGFAWVCVLGSLTLIAAALRSEPRLAPAANVARSSPARGARSR